MLCVGTINALFWRYVQNRDWSKEAHTLTGAWEHMLHMCIAFWKKNFVLIYLETTALEEPREWAVQCWLSALPIAKWGALFIVLSILYKYSPFLKGGC